MKVSVAVANGGELALGLRLIILVELVRELLLALR